MTHQERQLQALRRSQDAGLNMTQLADDGWSFDPEYGFTSDDVEPMAFAGRGAFPMLGPPATSTSIADNPRSTFNTRPYATRPSLAALQGGK